MRQDSAAHVLVLRRAAWSRRPSCGGIAPAATQRRREVELEASGCRGTEARHEQDAMKLRVCCVDQTRDFFLTEHPGKVTQLLRIRRLGDAPVALQDVDIEEPKRRQPHNYGVRAVLQLGEEHRLGLANVLRTKLIGWTPEVLAEVRHTVHVGADGRRGEVATLQLLKHELT